MKEIIYGIFAEDSANKIFIELAIPQLVSYFGFTEKILFIHEHEYSNHVVAKSGEYVKEMFISCITFGLKRIGIDFCFVGLDCDDNVYEDYYQEMMDELAEHKMQNKALIFIPVQAIEYWLWYLKVKKNDATLLKTPVVDRVHDRKKLKELVYERKRAGNKKSNPIVTELSKNIDIPWLRAHSASFDHFCNHFENYLKTYI